MKLRLCAATVGIFSILAVAPLWATENSYNLRDASVGTIEGLDAFLPAFNCPGKHLTKINFTSFSLSPDFVPIPWLTVPKVVEFEAGAEIPAIDVDLNANDLTPGTHQGVITIECVACDQGACGGRRLPSLVSVTIPHAAEFGASPRDAEFGGLVDNQPVSIHSLVTNVFNEIKQSDFADLEGASNVIETLENKYLDVDVFGPELSDVTFVRTVSTISKDGRPGVRVIPEEDEDPKPGNAVYAAWNQEEEIFVGVDMSLLGIYQARKNPGDYYVFTIGGEMGVIQKADLVHNLVHEGMHAAIGGKHNVATTSGGRGASLEEEQEGFRVGNAAARALGLPEADDMPQGSGYGGGNNPAYPLLFPGLAPGVGGADGSAETETPKDTRSSGLLPSDTDDAGLGFCSGEGMDFSCDGTPNYALACGDATSADSACAVASKKIAPPCEFSNSEWVCGQMPAAVIDCTLVECNYNSTKVADACIEIGSAFVCDQLPGFRLECPTQEECDDEDKWVIAPIVKDLVAGGLFPGTGQDTEIDLYESSETYPQINVPEALRMFAATQSTDCNLAGQGTPAQLVEVTGDRDGSRATMIRATRQFTHEIQPQTPTSDMQPDIGEEFNYFEYFFAPYADGLEMPPWPGPGSNFSDNGASEGPLKGIIEASPGRTGIIRTGDRFFRMQGQSFGSVIFDVRDMDYGHYLDPYPRQQMRIDTVTYSTMIYPDYDRRWALDALRRAGVETYEENVCRVVLLPVDPNYRRDARNGGNSWGAKQDDQWAIKRVGFTDDEASAWNLVSDTANSTIVAVIDTGLDWHHKDIDHRSIWRNEDEIADNNIDDDRNGYVDDVIGWDFVEQDNRPWDFDGHGTVVAGIIAAQHNDVGIAGINPQSQIMVLKGINNFGTTRASWIAEAIVYAVDNGARIINLSVGGPKVSQIEQAALAYAHEKGVLVVAAAGNEGVELGDFGPGGSNNVLTVGATHVDNRAAEFSNFGDKVDLVAPGVDVLSLRARYTDANFRPGQPDSEYSVGDNYVGDDNRYLHVSGTSFSTPIVAGVASLLMANNPAWSAAEVEHVLLQTATDVGLPGKDEYTGHGMVDARAALRVTPDFWVRAEISKIELEPAEAPQIARVYGTVDASVFKRAWMQIGPGENPGGWLFVGPKRKFPIRDGELGVISLQDFNSSGVWQVVINVEHSNGVIKRAAFPVTIQ